MKHTLAGPFPFDENAILASGREALSAVKERIAEGNPSKLAATSGHAPGLYVLLDRSNEEPRAARIAGFWVVLGSSWLTKGPAGPPDREPPVCKLLLDACTEEVWWNNLPVAPIRGGAWTPLVVLEWPVFLAARSAFAPPGPVVDEGADDVTAEEPEQWLTPVARQPARRETPRPSREARPVDAAAERYAGLPKGRGLMLVARGRMRKTRRLHEGHFEMVHPAAFGEGNEPIEIEEWLDLALDSKAHRVEEDAGHLLGRPLASYNGAVAFPITGWLTRGLDLWPQVPADVHRGHLTDREVQVKWVNQAKQALGSTTTVLSLVIPFSFLIQWIALPRPRPAAAIPPPGPQPAMSVCSADNQRFVDEFRCQVAYLQGEFDEGLQTPVCGDRDATLMPASRDLDLQAAFCGIYDRQQDGLKATVGRRTMEYSDLAASQACFNVLGYPHPYQLARTSSDRVVGDPVSFLENGMLGVQPLKELVTQLESICDDYRNRVQNRVEGAVFATHVGGAEGEEPVALRQLAVGIATTGINNDGQRCFGVGMSRGVDADGYSGICSATGRSDEVDTRHLKTKIWGALDGDLREGTVIERYTAARFGAPTDASGPPLWQCHLRLTGDVAEPVRKLLGPWDVPVPIPATYRTYGAGARSQLELDVTLTAIREGASAGTCWGVVSKRLASYAPAHPLVEPLEAEWPSTEQQLCGQVCAVAYNLSELGGTTRWVTPNADLSRCVSTTEPNFEVPDLGHGVIDYLRLPWSYAGREGWVADADHIVDQVCAFNLIAQGRIPSDGSYIVNQRAPAQWAGETAGGSRIAGGPDGLSIKAVAGMSRFGTGSAWSKDSCGHVALQCFTDLMLDVIGDEDFERYEWTSKWQAKVMALSRERTIELSRVHPWCVPVQPYLEAERQEATFDAPCRSGVEEARLHAQQALDRLTGTVSGGG